MVEITMSLDKSKLRHDIEHMSAVKEMTERRYVVPVPGAKTRSIRVPVESLSPRSFVIGLPSNSNWDPTTIAKALRKIQIDLGGATHVHGLYVLGIGFFETVPIERENEAKYRIKMWTEGDRLFRFGSALRQALDRWPQIPPGWTVDLSSYLGGSPTTLDE